MLFLSRKMGQSLHIGDDIHIVVMKGKGKTVMLGIEAPSDVAIERHERKHKPTDETKD